MANVLAQVEALINELDYDRRKKYISKIASIKERLQYEEMRLALIGNFSCGKSTFINALLKEPLLAVANMPTTAIPTYIDLLFGI